MKLAVANNALLEAPVYENHIRGSNWLAVIDIDPTSPGGLSRKFMDRGKGQCMYLTEQLGLFDAVEFGADYTTSMGKKRPHRWYGVIVAKTDDYLQVEHFADGVKAVLAAKSKRVDPAARTQALKEERQAHLDRVSKLDAEIAASEAPEDEPNAGEKQT